MVFPLIPILAIGGAGIIAGFFGGKNAGGGAIEIGTTKKSDQTTITNQITDTRTFSPTINRTFDLQFNTASGGSSIDTKKSQRIEQAPTTSPVITPSLTVIPQTAQGGGIGGSGSETTDFTGIALIGALGIGAFLLLNNKGKK